MSTHDLLLHLREHIDEIDLQLLDLLSKRAEVVKKIGLLKHEHGIQPLDQDRWKRVVDNLYDRANVLQIPSSIVRSIWNTIHEWSLSIESEI